MGDFLNSSIFSIIPKFDSISGDGGYLGGVIPGGMTRDGHDLPSVISIAGREVVYSAVRWGVGFRVSVWENPG